MEKFRIAMDSMAQVTAMIFVILGSVFAIGGALEPSHSPFPKLLP